MCPSSVSFPNLKNFPACQQNLCTLWDHWFSQNEPQPPNLTHATSCSFQLWQHFNRLTLISLNSRDWKVPLNCPPAMASHGECAFLWCALNKSTRLANAICLHPGSLVSSVNLWWSICRNTSNLLMEVPFKFHEPTCGQSRGEEHLGGLFKCPRYTLQSNV